MATPRAANLHSPGVKVQIPPLKARNLAGPAACLRPEPEERSKVGFKPLGSGKDRAELASGERVDLIDAAAGPPLHVVHGIGRD
jgi:hypothetical protein